MRIITHIKLWRYNMKKQIIALSLITLLGACSSNTEQETSVGTIPTWIMSPPEEPNTLATTECVLFTGNLGIDKQEATANARASLAQRIQTNVSVMDKTYKDKIATNGNLQTGNTFSSVSKQITHLSLNGTTIKKIDIVEIDTKTNLCVLVTIGESKEIFNQLIEASERKLSPQQKDVLYMEFKAERANAELDKEIKKL